MNVDLSMCTTAEVVILLAPELHEIVQIISVAARKHNPEKTGGWFAFWHTDPNGVVALPVIGIPGGLVSPDRFLLFNHFANEKAVRLAGRPHDISSWQSRDESDPDQMKHRYGGAIRCSRNSGMQPIFSFSGFSEDEDEAVCAILAMRCQMMTDEYLLRIIEASGNSLLAEYRSSRDTKHPW